VDTFPRWRLDKVEKVAEIGMITEEEEKKPRRRRIFHTAGFKAGAIIPMGGYAESSSLTHLGALYWYETPQFAVELSFYFAFTSNLGLAEGGHAHEIVAPELSLLYILSKGDLSPYFGGGVGLGFIGLYPEGFNIGSAYGMSFNGGGGVVFLRTYDIRILLDVRYRVNMAQVSGFIEGDEGLNGPHHGIMLSIGFTYRSTRGCCFGGGGGGCL